LLLLEMSSAVALKTHWSLFWYDIIVIVRWFDACDSSGVNVKQHENYLKE
jgi:hypothetical protein